MKRYNLASFHFFAVRNVLLLSPRLWLSHMMTFINWESLLKITHAENLFSCQSDPLPLVHINTILVLDGRFGWKIR